MKPSKILPGVIRAVAFVPFVILFAISGCAKKETVQNVLRVGYFPNVTHAQGVIGCELTAQNKGWFEQRLGPGITLQWVPYDAGPVAMDAMRKGDIDLTYAGPNPALAAYMRSDGDAVRIIAGAASGGAALLVAQKSGIKTPADFKGKVLATPQYGNTQDIAARVWLKSHGLAIINQAGGDVKIIPTANTDLLTLFQHGHIDAAWTVEPWVSRIEREAQGRLYIEQKDALTTVLIASVAALKDKREYVQKFLKAHHELTAWINQNPADAQRLVQAGIGKTAGGGITLELVQASWKRLHFTTDAPLKFFEELVAQSREHGFINSGASLDRLIDGSLAR